MRLQVSIDFGKNNQTSLSFDSVEQITEFINVSHLDDLFNLPTSNEGKKGFQLSDSVDSPLTPLDGSYTFFDDEKGYSGIVTKGISNSTLGPYKYGMPSGSDRIYFRIKNQIPETFFIVFDTQSNEYAPAFSIHSVEANTYTLITNNTSPVVILPTSLLEGASVNDTFYLMIWSWSKPQTSAKVSRIATYPRFDFTSRDIIKMTCSENLFDSAMQIRPGVCEQYASIDIYDRYGVLHSMFIREELTKTNQVNIYAIDDSEQKSYLLGTYNVTAGEAEHDSNIVSFDCKDVTYLFESIQIDALYVHKRSCHALLNRLFDAVNMPWRYIDAQTETMCKNIQTPNSWSMTDQASKILEKICTLGMLRIYWYIDAFIVARCINVDT